ncbi:40S ribosomal protein S11-2 [Durusdinium trenchii]|uniref:40S ribosomal protein S11-2 n=1 Tax=Durusdinium trenchii TaxID=1381693 RepID=A0ABP0SPS2_9DINO
MATETTVGIAQTEKAFLKQDGMFHLTKSKKMQAKKNRKGQIRYYKNIGLGFKTPAEAIEGIYIDKKCPFTGNVSIRGRVLKGLVVSNKMQKTIIMRRDYLHYIKKYKRYEKRHRNVPAHLSPCFTVKEGDIVTVGQCRPLSKTVRFNVIDVEPCSTQKPVNVKKQFRMF